MSRELVFRAWDTYDNKWRYFKIGQSFGTFGESLYKSLCLEGATFYQNTGLKDKNGVEIYEGDILRLDDGDVSHHRIYWDNKAGRWMDERLEDGDSLTCYDEFAFVTDCKIIGNIHQNPELLK